MIKDVFRLEKYSPFLGSTQHYATIKLWHPMAPDSRKKRISYRATPEKKNIQRHHKNRPRGVRVEVNLSW